MLRHAILVLLAVSAATSHCSAEEAAGKPAPIRFLISFDDGPSGDHVNNSTEQVLDVLAHNGVQPGVKALFFAQTEAVRGGGTEMGRKMLAREQAEGHLIEFHTATPHHAETRESSAKQGERGRFGHAGMARCAARSSR